MMNPRYALAASTILCALAACDTPEAHRATPPEPAVGTDPADDTDRVAATLEHERDRCVRFRERAHHCREALVDPWIRARAASCPDLAPRLATPEGRAELRAAALAEFEADGSGPLGPRRARCEAAAAQLPDSLRDYTVQMDDCRLEAGCAAWTACVVPAFERMLAAGRGLR